MAWLSVHIDKKKDNKNVIGLVSLCVWASEHCQWTFKGNSSEISSHKESLYLILKARVMLLLIAIN